MFCGKLLKLCSLFVFCPVLFAASAFADGDLAKKLDAGTWAENPRYLTFGKYNGHALKWRILEVKDKDPDFGGKKTAFLLLDDVLRNSDGVIAKATFNKTNSNNFPDSSISKWLNDGTNGFIFSAGLNHYQEGILNTTYDPDNSYEYSWYDGPAKTSSKVFLLSVDEVANPKYFIDAHAKTAPQILTPNTDRSVGATYWLRSPAHLQDLTAVVTPDGSIYYFTNVQKQLAIRPALKIDLSSPVFTSVSAQGE